MHVNKTKFVRNSSLGCYHMTCIGKTNIQANKRGLLSTLIDTQEYLFNVLI